MATMFIDSNVEGAVYRVVYHRESGGDLYIGPLIGVPWSQDCNFAGTLTITWYDIGGYITPPPEGPIDIDGLSDVHFYGEYIGTGEPPAQLWPNGTLLQYGITSTIIRVENATPEGVVWRYDVYDASNNLIGNYREADLLGMGCAVYVPPEPEPSPSRFPWWIAGAGTLGLVLLAARNNRRNHGRS